MERLFLFQRFRFSWVILSRGISWRSGLGCNLSHRQFYPTTLIDVQHLDLHFLTFRKVIGHILNTLIGNL
jgi:hypothetical protein